MQITNVCAVTHSLSHFCSLPNTVETRVHCAAVPASPTIAHSTAHCTFNTHRPSLAAAHDLASAYNAAVDMLTLPGTRTITTSGGPRCTGVVNPSYGPCNLSKILVEIADMLHGRTCHVHVCGQRRLPLSRLPYMAHSTLLPHKTAFHTLVTHLDPMRTCNAMSDDALVRISNYTVIAWWRTREVARLDCTRHTLSRIQHHPSPQSAAPHDLMCMQRPIQHLQIWTIMHPGCVRYACAHI